MSEQTTGTAVATRENDALQTQLQSAYQRDKMIRAMAQQIASESWGKALSAHTQAAMARYAMEAGLDPVRHIDVLGGRVYINAQAYMDRLASDPEFEGVTYRNVTADEDGRAEWGVPKHALAAYIVTVRHRGRDFTEIGYAPKRANDSVGKEFPHEKARTSGIRRAAKMAVPMWTQKMEEQFTAVEALLVEQSEREIRQTLPVEKEPPRLAAAIPAGKTQAQHEDDLAREAADMDAAGLEGDLFTDGES